MQATPADDVRPREEPREETSALALRGRSEQELQRLYAAQRSPQVREELVRRFMPLARSLAMRYRRQTESIDDLVQVANLGLVKAIDGFDPDRGKPFGAYAVPTILGELRRHFRDHVWNLRLPRGLGELAMKVEATSDLLTERLGRFPTATEIAGHLEILVEDVLEALEASHARRALSLDAPRPGEDAEGAPASEAIPSGEGGYDRVEANLAAGAAGLEEREWEVLRLRFAEDLTQSEIGERLGVSQMQVSRISRAALWKLLAAMRGEVAEGSAPPAVPRRRRRD